MFNTLIIYESFFGNTKKLAEEIARAFLPESTKVVSVEDFDISLLHDIQLIIAGTPTRAFQTGPATKAWLHSLPDNALNGIEAACFDTRANPQEVKNFVFNVLSKTFGFATEPLAKGLAKKGAKLLVNPEYFYITGSGMDAEHTTLAESEIARASAWGRQICSSMLEKQTP